MVNEESETAFYDSLCQLIEGTEKIMRSTTHRYEPLQDDAVNYVEGAFYSNLIRLYQQNLNEKFFKMVRMSMTDRGELQEVMRPFFKRAKDTSESSYNKGEMDFYVLSPGQPPTKLGLLPEMSFGDVAVLSAQGNHIVGDNKMG
ncbi:MAG: hypothetical protein ACMUHU_00935, partial [Thermoplasmatota archaeon]